MALDGAEKSSCVKAARSGLFAPEHVVAASAASCRPKALERGVADVRELDDTDATQNGHYYVLVFGYENSCFVDLGPCGVVGSNVLWVTVYPRPQFTMTTKFQLGELWVTIRNVAVSRGDSLFIMQAFNYRLCWTRRAAAPGCVSEKLLGWIPETKSIRVSKRLTNPLRLTLYVEGQRVLTKIVRLPKRK